jgi:CBS domain containing-hemolysin-like protein
MPGGTHVDEAQRALGFDLPTGEFETVAGMVIAARGEFPQVGEVVAIELPIDPEDLLHENVAAIRILHVEILEIHRHVPSVVRMTLAEVHA